MTATVVSLASKRRNHAPARMCKACRPDFTCAPHRLLQLSERLVAARGAGLEAEAIADALAVIDGITAHFLPDERTAR